MTPDTDAIEQVLRIWLGGSPEQNKRAAERIMDLFAGWQPFETAPKDDDQPLLLYYLAYEADGHKFRSAVEIGFGSDAFWSRTPTHWMPLPLGPDGKRAELV
jgi:hypothetical protein